MLTLNEYFIKACDRLPEEAIRVMSSLEGKGSMNKEGLSLTAKVKRAVLDHIVMQLYALGFVEIETEGKSKICSLTPLGNNFLELIKAG
ncbi:MAG: transcriptional regulator [Clostridiales bacterium]|nr:transcriptional regulator [Clostridiales bacterium]MCF8022259.1 transcriptional regulator [Clostridiales bacterium]